MLYVKKITLEGELPADSYLHQIPAVRFLAENPITLEKDVTVFVGENGSGKSTLIEAIAVALGFNPEGGTRNFSFSTHNSHSPLHESLCVARTAARMKDGFFLRAESFYNVATHIEEMDRQPAASRRIIESYGGVSLHNQSHGESFMALVENRFSGNGLYILDEPEAALSPMRLMRLICRMHELVQMHSQFIISTHSPILMAFPDADVLEIAESGIRRVSFCETEHWQTMKMFMDDPERMMHYLFAPEER